MGRSRSEDPGTTCPAAVLSDHIKLAPRARPNFLTTRPRLTVRPVAGRERFQHRVCDLVKWRRNAKFTAEANNLATNPFVLQWFAGFQVEPVDLTTYGALSALLLGVSLLATWLPARRAT